LQAFGGVLFQTLLDEIADLVRYGAEVGLLLDYAREDVGQVLALEQAFACDEFVEHHAEGPDIGAAVGFFAASLLGSHIGWSAKHGSLNGTAERQRGIAV
jgi:hypothetical protein